MIFWKNKEQTIKHMQFKFDPVPTESTQICLFQERCIRNILHGKFGQLLIKYGLVFYKNWVVQIHTKYSLGTSQNNLTFGTRKMKNGFFVHWKWKLPLTNLFPIPICTHLHKMRSLGKTILWNNHYYRSFGLKATNRHTRLLILRRLF